MQLDTDKVLLLEQPFLKVPYETMRRNLRSSQRLMERDLASCQSSLADLAKKGTTGPEAIKQIESVLGRMRGIKRKLDDLEAANKSIYDNCATRVEHLNRLHAITAFSDPAYAPWAKERLARHLVDYLVRHDPPLFGSARTLSRAEGVEAYVDCELELFEECIRIERALAAHKVTDALAWCRDNATGLKKLKSTLEFDLRYQELIELARAGKQTEAITHARKHLVPWNETHAAEVRAAMTLLAFSPDTKCAPYARLYDVARWSRLATSFRSTLFALHNLPPLPLLSLSLHTGLASLKLPACYTSASAGERNSDCPVCDADPSSGLGQLAEGASVPFAHHVNSSMVCKLSGKIMESEPLALPNGRVYSKEALEMMALKNDGMVTCPRTGDSFEFASTRKVFIS